MAFKHVYWTDEKLLEELSIRLSSECIRTGQKREVLAHQAGVSEHTFNRLMQTGTSTTTALLRVADALHCDLVLVRRITAPKPLRPTPPKAKIIKEIQYKFINNERTYKTPHNVKTPPTGRKVGRPRTLREKGPVITVPILRGWEPGKPQRASKKQDFDRAIEQRDFLADDDPQQPDGQA